MGPIRLSGHVVKRQVLQDSAQIRANRPETGETKTEDVSKFFFHSIKQRTTAMAAITPLGGHEVDNDLASAMLLNPV